MTPVGKLLVSILSLVAATPLWAEKQQHCEWWRVRGGGDDYQQELEMLLTDLGQRFGPQFVAAIEQNKKDHDEDCRKSCETFYCATKHTEWTSGDSHMNITRHSFGPVPPEDFAGEFGFPLDLIKVTDQPLFTAQEAVQVTATAREEGLDDNEFPSGKYKLAGDWIDKDKLPRTLAWFNAKLESSFFPLLAHLFPEIIRDTTVLRAHSVSLLKYNSSHPRTDVHVDNGILALTVAMTPLTEYTGGGTFFEHLDDLIIMDAGQGTFRPGNVRHGGHRVTDGTRYILGAFLLLEDRVEHVRRLKNRGTDFRRKGDMIQAAQHFEWALAINPDCTTCLKDWAEILLASKHFSAAEEKIRTALSLLEEKDSDALFTLGVILSEQGRDAESIEAYQKSVALNGEDAELLFNLGVKLGAAGNMTGEVEMYRRATTIDPTLGGAWLNWGTTLAEKSNLEEALHCGTEVAPKAMVNLGLIYYTRAGKHISTSELGSAQSEALRSAEFLDAAKPLLDSLVTQSTDSTSYLTQHKALRLQCHRLLGQLYAGKGDLVSSENEFRNAVNTFPNEKGAWFALSKILGAQGKTDEAAEIMQKLGSG